MRYTNRMIEINHFVYICFVAQTTPATMPFKTSVLIRDGTARWNTTPASNGTDQSDWKSPTLCGINVNFKKGQIIGVVGSTGAGKSSLLHALLRELPLESGSLRVEGSVSYAAQDPWVFAGTVRQNILFGLAMDRERYDAVVEACALLKDFDHLEHGDSTIVGERGASLSGGQKARIK